jgi:hypothetical protein
MGLFEIVETFLHSNIRIHRKKRYVFLTINSVLPTIQATETE